MGVMASDAQGRCSWDQLYQEATQGHSDTAVGKLVLDGTHGSYLSIRTNSWAPADKGACNRREHFHRQHLAGALQGDLSATAPQASPACLARRGWL